MSTLKNIITMKNTDYQNQPLFFGKEGMPVQRYDRYKDKKIFQNFKAQINFMWRPEEISLSAQERHTYNNLRPHEKEIFTKNLKFQILLDSVQARGINYLQEYCTNTELEAAMTWWSAFEQLHSYSYSYIIQDVYPNPTAMFDSIAEDEEIVKRATSVTEYYNDLLDRLPEDTEDDKKTKFYLALNSVNILEGIRFYVSFACSYALAENDKMLGCAGIISLINRDENLHLGLTQHLIKLLDTDETEGFTHIAAKCKDQVEKMFLDAVDEEIEWAKYLFKDGSLIGLNSDILGTYMKHLCNKRLKGLNRKPLFPEITKNPLPWMTHWTNSKAVQVAPQEVTVESYTIGSYVNNIDEVDWQAKYSVANSQAANA